MNWNHSLSKFAVVVLATMAVVGCAQLRPRIPPPGSSFDQLMQPGVEPLDVALPPGDATSSPTLQGAAAAPGFTPPVSVSAPATTYPPANVAAVPAPAPETALPGARAVRAPDSGWKSIRGQNAPPATNNKPIIRGQSPGPYGNPGVAPGGYPAAGVRQPYPAGSLPPPVTSQPAPVYNAPGAAAPVYGAPGIAPAPAGAVPAGPAPAYGAPGFTPAGPSFYQPAQPGQVIGPAFGGMNPNIVPTPDQLPATPTPLDILLEETRTGRFMFGVGVNSDLGFTGNITIDERNFDIMNPPKSWDQVLNGTAWRGRGQGFRLEAQPGTQVQRYMVSFTEPYLFNTPISSSVSGYYFDRVYQDWFESRLGGRVGLGYRLTPDLSVNGSIRAEDVNIRNPRVAVPELVAALGHTDLYGAKFGVMHDTRDLPFFPTEGHLINVSYEQVFGEFVFPKFDASIAQYFMLRERPDGSGRHTLAMTLNYGMLGSDAPIFENYFAGGFSSLRGFSFRGASPTDNTVRVGGRLQLLGSVEYFFPLTADDMIKGVTFCDFGTVERELQIHSENFRVAPGFGFRINVPALGPAPLAFDFAFPVAYAATDQRQMFSFYVGFARQ